MMKDRQRACGKSRLAAARKSRSVHVIPRTAGSSPEDGEFVPKHDDLQLLEIVRPKAPDGQLQNPPKHQNNAARRTKPPA
jgi:hypothetical protein